LWGREGLAITHGEQHTGGKPLLREVAQARRILRPHLPQLELGADARVGERDELRFFDITGRRGNGITVRVVLGVSQRARHPLDQLVRHGVLQPLRFGVHTTPVVPEVLREIELEDPVPAIIRSAARRPCEVSCTPR